MTPERHLLIVDDSPLVANALRVLFEMSGYRVSIANTVSDAVASHLADTADCVLLDLSLPDGDGLSVLSQLGAVGAVPPTIALTGHDDDATRKRCLAAGCRQVLLKPVPVAELLALVRSLETGHP